MEPTYLTKTIALARRPFRENDIMVTVYSADKGKLDLVGRGAKKISSKLAAHLEPITLANIMVVYGRRFDYVGAAASLESFPRLKNNFEKIAVAGRVINIFDKIIKPGQTDYQVFRLLLEFLRFLDEVKERKSYDLFYYFFLLKFLAVLGHKPELFYCVTCRRRVKMVNHYFSLTKGGLVCLSCFSSKQASVNSKTPGELPGKAFNSTLGAILPNLIISVDCIKVLRLILDKDFSFLAKIKVNNNLNNELKKVVNSFYRYIF
jgi:DNA repair protein RecO (recombination protein O)